MNYIGKRVTAHYRKIIKGSVLFHTCFSQSNPLKWRWVIGVEPPSVSTVAVKAVASFIQNIQK